VSGLRVTYVFGCAILIHGACIIYSIAAVVLMALRAALTLEKDILPRASFILLLRKAAQARKWSMQKRPWRKPFADSPSIQQHHAAVHHESSFNNTVAKKLRLATRNGFCHATLTAKAHARTRRVSCAPVLLLRHNPPQVPWSPTVPSYRRRAARKPCRRKKL
jgi:hypothetical protein